MAWRGLAPHDAYRWENRLRLLGRHFASRLRELKVKRVASWTSSTTSSTSEFSSRHGGVNGESERRRARRTVLNHPRVR